MPVTDGPELSSTGIGFATARQLANHGATVYLAVRDPSKGKAAAEQIELEAVAAGLKDRVGKVKVLQLDLSSVSQTKEAANSFLRLERRLDILGESSSVDMSLARLRRAWTPSEQRRFVSSITITPAHSDSFAT